MRTSNEKMEPPTRESIWKRITDDLKQRELFKLKLLFFVHSSTSSIIYPYLTVFMGDLGMNTKEIGILSFTVSFLGIFLLPITSIVGIISDRMGNFKSIAVLIMIIGGCIPFIFLSVPQARIIIQYPENITMSLECIHNDLSFIPSEGELCYEPIKTTTSRRHGPADCNEKKITFSKNSNVVQLYTCGMMCTHKNLNLTEQGASLMSRVEKYTVNWTDTNATSLASRQFAITGENFSTTWSARTGKKKIFNSTVQAFNSSLYFFPTPDLLRFRCDNKTCAIEKVEDKRQENNSMEFAELEKLHCEWKIWEKSSVTVNLHPVNGKPSYQESFPQCQPRCLVQAKRANRCNETKTEIEQNVPLSLYSFLACRAALIIFSSTALILVEGAIISILRARNADYGLQYVYASIGGMFSGQISGLLIGAFSTAERSDYRPAFYFYAFLKFASAVIICNVDLKIKTPSKHVLKDIVAVLKKVEVLVLLIICFMHGICNGIIETYLFPFLKGLDASAGLLGSTIFVGKLSGIPFIIFSGPILDYFGHSKVLIFSFIVYAIRYIGYSIITQAWQSLIFEVMESVSSSLALTTLITYGAKLSSTGTDTTIQGLIGGLYHGLGRGVGSLTGSMFIKNICYRNTFRLCGGITVIFSIGYFLFYKFYLVPRTPSAKVREVEPGSSNGMKNTLEMKFRGEVNSTYVSDEAKRT